MIEHNNSTARMHTCCRVTNVCVSWEKNTRFSVNPRIRSWTAAWFWGKNEKIDQISYYKQILDNTSTSEYYMTCSQSITRTSWSWIAPMSSMTYTTFRDEGAVYRLPGLRSRLRINNSCACNLLKTRQTDRVLGSTCTSAAVVDSVHVTHTTQQSSSRPFIISRAASDLPVYVNVRISTIRSSCMKRATHLNHDCPQ